MENSNKTIVAFHIGRGGHFHNQGHLSFIGENKISEYTRDLFLKFENENDFSNRFGFDSTGDEDQKCILDLITDRDFKQLEEKFGITEEMLGTEQYFDGNDNPVGLTSAEEDLGIGTIDIDGDYDTTYTKFLEDCTEKELQLIVNSKNYVSDYILYFAKKELGIEEEDEEENE